MKPIYAVLGIVVLACIVFPPIRFHRYRPGASTVVQSGSVGTLEPKIVAERFWEERLLPAARTAADAPTVIAALRADAAAARKQYARSPAIGGPSYFFVRGSGRIVRKEKNQIGLSLDRAAGNDDPKPDLVIGIGPLFGNAVRDGTGMLSPGDFPNSSDYNALSSELNKLVKERVFPSLRDQAAVGARVRFAGIAEVADQESNPFPLHLVPVLVEVQ